MYDTFAAGLTAVLREQGIMPDYAAGLSLGEYSALACAGVFDMQTAVALTAFRGKAMAAARCRAHLWDDSRFGIG